MHNNEKSRYNPLMKTIAVVMAVLMVFSGGVITCYAQGAGVPEKLEMENMLSDYVEELVDLSDAKSIDAEKTADNELYLNMKDGSTTVYSFSEPITYIDENGELKCKDNSITAQTDKEKKAQGYDYCNGNNDYRIHLSSDSAKGIFVEYNDIAFSFSPLSSVDAPGYISNGEINGEKFEDFEYADLYGTGTLLKYFLQINGVKEEIFLDEKIGSNVFRFSLKTSGCTPVLNEDGSISLISNESGEEVQKLTAPFAYDSAHTEGIADEHYTEDCAYSLETLSENNYVLTLTVSKAWLESESTVYPVTIDPTTATLSNHMDLPIHSGRADAGTHEDNNAVGTSSQYGTSRTLVYYLYPSDIQPYAKINSAYYWTRELTGRTSDMNVGIYKLTSGWNNSYTWAQRPDWDPKRVDVRNINTASPDTENHLWYKFNITSIAQDHMNGSANRGFMMKYENEDAAAKNLRTFAQLEYSVSSMRPYTVINYTNDTTAPTFDSFTKSPETRWHNDDVVLSVNGAKDDISGIKAYSFSDDTSVRKWQSSNKATIKESCNIYAHIIDYASNQVYCGCIGVRIDKVAPTISDVSVSNTDNNTISVSVTAFDDNSGVAGYSFDGGKTWQAESSAVLAANIRLNVSVKDNAGNITSYSEAAGAAPEIYKDNNLIHIYTAPLSSSAVEYRINNGDWLEYKSPIEISVGEETVVDARISGDNSQIVSKTFNNTIGEYTEAVSDMSVSYFGAGFDIARSYNSANASSDNNGWFYSFNSKIDLLSSTDNVIYAVMPDGETFAFEKTAGGNLYANLFSGYTLTVTETQFIIKCDDMQYTYNESGVLCAVSDCYNNSIAFENADGKITSITAGENRVYAIGYNANGDVEQITNPLGESIKYEYTDGRLSKAYWDKNSFVIEKNLDLILGEYEYNSAGKISKSLFTNITYDANGRVVKELNADGSFTDYTYTSEFYEYPSESKAVSVIKVTAASSDETSTETRVNNALLTVTSTDTEGSTTVYKYNSDYRVISEKSENSEIAYTYDESGKVRSSSSDNSETAYTYNSIGNIESEITVSKNDEDKETKLFTKYEYENGVLSKTTQSENEDYSNAVISTYANGLLVKTADSTDVTALAVTDYSYDSFGNTINVVSSAVSENGSTETETVTYTYDKLNRNISVTDKDGTSSYVYDAAGNPIKETDLNGTKRTILDEYGRAMQFIPSDCYDENFDNLPVEDSYADSSAGNIYEYNADNQLSKEKNHLDIVTEYTYFNSGAKKTEKFDIYLFTYNENESIKSIEINGKKYVDYVYKNDYLSEERFSNGQTVFYEYNEYGLISAKKYKASALSETTRLAEYFYSDSVSEEGKPTIISEINYESNQKIIYGENNLVSVFNIELNENGNEVLKLCYSYVDNQETDENNITNLKSSLKSFSDKSLSINYEENKDVYSLISQANGDVLSSFSCNYTQDEENTTTAVSITKALNDETVDLLKTEYEYNENDYISKMITTAADGSVTSSSYLYDKNNNLIEYHPDENSVIYYTYDNQNQIIREDINYSNRYSETRLYNYDSRGNVTSVESYDYTRGDVSNLGFKNIQFELEYDEVWLDEIASIDDMPVLYDETGNPISLAECTFEWEKGTQLKSITYQGDEIVSYTYDSNGIRLSKTYCGETVYYTNENGTITSQYQLDDNGSKINEINFIYSQNNELLAALYNGKTYYYVKNEMGDVTGIVNEAGVTVIEYCYNAWGEVPRCDINSSLPESSADYQFAELNPMLYRSYYYDAETEMYYLQSRYYMPQLCRFINADDPELVQMNKHKNTDTNLYSYCFNNPVNNDDKTGSWGAEVHNGYNAKDKSNDYCNVTRINGKLTRYGTYAWAKDCGFNHNKAKKLALYCEDLDINYPSYTYGVSTLVADQLTPSQLDKLYIYQGWHFNLNKTGTDSRVLYANRRMNDAVGFWNMHSFQKAIHHLGWGLHAVQDMEAHGQIGRGEWIPQHIFPTLGNPNHILKKADSIDFDWKNREHIKLIDGDGSRWRLRSSERMSRNYINKFLNRIGGYINAWQY